MGSCGIIGREMGVKVEWRMGKGKGWQRAMMPDVKLRGRQRPISHGRRRGAEISRPADRQKVGVLDAVEWRGNKGVGAETGGDNSDGRVDEKEEVLEQCGGVARSEG